MPYPCEILRPFFKFLIFPPPAILLLFAWVTTPGLQGEPALENPPGYTPPNIVLILADDLDFDEIGVYDFREFPSRTGAGAKGFTQWRENWRNYKDPRMWTPHIDSLARDGAIFERFYVTTGVCTPSRYSIMTGRYASRSPGLEGKIPEGEPANVDWNTFLDPQEPHLARLLDRKGYHTGLVGKWHLGFPQDLVEPVPADADPRESKVAERIHANYARSITYMEKKVGFDEVDRLYLVNKESRKLGIPDSLRHHNLEWITAGAVNFLEKNGNNQNPFFLFMSLTIPHSQYDAIYGEMAGADPLATPAGLLEEAPDVQPSRNNIRKRLQERGIDTRNAMATWMDDSVGAVLKKLEALGIAENTIVIFTSDHQNRGKFSAYEGSRVPFLIRWPGRIEAGTTVKSLCANIDLLPTLLEVAGGSVPASVKVDGRSFLDLLNGEAGKSWRTSLLLECHYSRAVVTEQWKYLVNRPPEAVRQKMDEDWRHYAETGSRRTVNWTGKHNPHDWGEVGIRYVLDVDFPHYFDYDQLYNLQADPFEQVNLADYPQYKTVLNTLRETLREHSAELPYPFGEFSP